MSNWYYEMKGGENMYTVQQVQAADFLLKKLLIENISPFSDLNLKFVINLNGTYWIGDFIQFKNDAPVQFFIEDDGDVEYMRFYADGSNATAIFKKIMDTYRKETYRGAFYINPFKKIKTLDLLFNTLFKLVVLSDIQVDDSPIYPYLLNAKSLDGKLELPFINLTDQEIQVVSLIEVTNESV